jgi:site-specific recombinase XerD
MSETTSAPHGPRSHRPRTRAGVPTRELPDPGPLGYMIDSWRLKLEGDLKAGGTVRTYTAAATRLAGWLLKPDWVTPPPKPRQRPGEPPKRSSRRPGRSSQSAKTSSTARAHQQNAEPDTDWTAPVTDWLDAQTPHIQGFMAWLGKHYSTGYANNQYRAIQQFWKWFAQEESVPDPMAYMRPPKLAVRLTQVVSRDEMIALIKTAEKVRAPKYATPKAMKGYQFEARRDAALLRLLACTGCRLAEIADLDIAGINLRERSAIVIGKGNKQRKVRFDAKCAQALDRYLRMRSAHRHASSPKLWLGMHDRIPMTKQGIYQVVVRRGKQAGVTLYPHMFRHTFTHNWLKQGGAAGDLQVLQGWESDQMVYHYGKIAKAERAESHYDQINVMDGV